MTTLLNGGGQPSYADVQLPEDPTLAPTLDLSSALQPGAIAPRPESNDGPAVKLYGHALALSRPASYELQGVRQAMSAGLDALAWPTPVPLLESRPVVEQAEPAEPFDEAGDDEQAVYGLGSDDSDWDAVYGLEGDTAEPLDWQELESEIEHETETDTGEELEPELHAAIESALAQQLSSMQTFEPESTLHELFDSEPEPEDLRAFDDDDDDVIEVAGETVSNGSSATGALSFEDIDRMFEEDFA